MRKTKSKAKGGLPMKKRLLSALWVAGISLMLAVPAYAYTGTANGGNGGLGNGMGSYEKAEGKTSHARGTTMHGGTGYRAQGTGTMRNRDVSVYGTGTGTQFLNGYGNDNRLRNGVTGTAYAPGRYGARAYPNGAGTYRTAATTTSNGMGWGWLGLLGLLGLFGFRSRNPQRD